MYLWPDAFEQTAQQRSLAEAYLPGEDRESLALLDYIAQLRKRFPMAGCQIKEAGVRAQAERLQATVVISFVYPHGTLSEDCSCVEPHRPYAENETSGGNRERVI